MNREEIFNITTRRSLRPVIKWLDDPSISEILINGPQDIYIERNGLLEKTGASFDDEESLNTAARNIAQYVNKRITPQTARLDARLPDGSRVHMVFPRCARIGVCLAIRKFGRQAFSLDYLVKAGSLVAAAREYIELMVALGRNLIVSGGTGTGKTSLLNAISAVIPSNERIIVIEDSAELQFQQPHVVSLETAPADHHGAGAVTIRDLFHSALRMRPDRIIIGECRGGEALDLIQAMTSGHGGSMSTLHANNGRDALNRLETMALMSGVDLPLAALRAQVSSAIEVIVQTTRLADGRRMVTEISEVGSLTSHGQYTVTPIFSFSPQAEKETPVLTWTGITSTHGPMLDLKQLRAKVELTARIFAPVNQSQATGR